MRRLQQIRKDTRVKTPASHRRSSQLPDSARPSQARQTHLHRRRKPRAPSQTANNDPRVSKREGGRVMPSPASQHPGAAEQRRQPRPRAPPRSRRERHETVATGSHYHREAHRHAKRRARVIPERWSRGARCTLLALFFRALPHAGAARQWRNNARKLTLTAELGATFFGSDWRLTCVNNASSVGSTVYVCDYGETS